MTTTRIDTRTKEGKRQKARLVAEVLRMREDGFPMQVIADELGIDSATVSAWLCNYGRLALVVRPTAHRDNSTTRKRATQQRARREAIQRRREAARRKRNMDAARKHLAEVRQTGAAPWWHAHTPAALMSAEDRRLLDEVTAEQAREAARDSAGWGERPAGSESARGMASLDEVQFDNGRGSAMDRVTNLRDYTFASEIEEIMCTNGTEASRFGAKRQWMRGLAA